MKSYFKTFIFATITLGLFYICLLEVTDNLGNETVISDESGICSKCNEDTMVDENDNCKECQPRDE